jgi:hypothetical protein
MTVEDANGGLSPAMADTPEITTGFLRMISECFIVQQDMS